MKMETREIKKSKKGERKRAKGRRLRGERWRKILIEKKVSRNKEEH
jgi:hypothetical protein